MDYRSIILTKEDGVATIQMNSPKTMNALDDTISAELTHAYHEVADDREVGAVILTGADRAFCAGGDLKIFLQILNFDQGRAHACSASFP